MFSLFLDMISLLLLFRISHLYSPSFGVVYLGGHEGLRLRLFNDLDSKMSVVSPLLLGWLGLWDLSLT